MLTTNDVRVLRLLVEHGPHTRDEMAAALRHGFGARPALLRLRPLARRGLLTNGDIVGHDGSVMLDITGEGARALRAADRV